MYPEIITRENHRTNDNFQSSTLQNENKDGSAVDLKLCNKGMHNGFLDVSQGLCSKFSEIHLMLTSKQNANLHICFYV